MSTSPPDPSDPVERRRFGASALTIEDFRSVRRWLVVLGVITVLAVGLAAYALIATQESDDEKASLDRVAVLEEQLRDRIRQLDRRLGRASEESDVRRLERSSASQAQVAAIERRLRRVESDMTEAADTAAAAGRGVQRLDNRVDIVVREQREQRERRDR